jgi:hypothetical protein
MFFLIYSNFLLSAPNVFLNSIPKCGTYLTLKCLQKLINKNFLTCSGWTNLKQEEIRILNGRIYKAHALYSLDNIRLALGNNLKTIFVIRDPRAQVVSMAKWVKKHPKVWKKHRDKSLREVIVELIQDCSDIYSTQFESAKLRTINNIQELYCEYLGWIETSNVLTIKFEDLVGFQGGGSNELQIKVVKEIADHVNVKLSLSEIKQISQQLFGSSSTFTTGQISSWRDYFDDDIKAMFKENAADLLIKLGYEKGFDW